MGRFDKHLAAFAALFLIFAGVTSSARAEPVTLKLGHIGAPGSLFDMSAREFARRVNEELAGRAEATVFGSSQLGSDRDMLQKLRLGTVDFSMPSTIMSTIADEFGLFEMPYLIRDRAQMKRIEAAVFWDRMAPAAEARGYKILAIWENGFRHITNNVRPIRAPEDLAGIKLRTPRGVWRVKMFRAYGANPTPMSFSEVFSALQTGVIDGQENPLSNIYTAKFNEVQQYLSLTSHVYTPAYLTAGARRWSRLPADLRADLERIAREVQDFVYATATGLDDQLLEQLRESGIAINQADRQAFEAASQPIYDEFAETVDGGADLIAAARDAADSP